MAAFRGIASAHSLVLRAKPDVVLPEFLPFFMQSDEFMERVERISVGSLSPTINWKTLAAEEFVLPPFQEQRRIMLLILRLRQVIDAYEDAEHALRNLEAAAMARAFSAQAIYSRKSPDASLRDLCSRITDGTHQPPPLAESGVPFITIGNFQDGRIDWAVTKWVSHNTYEDLTRRFRPGPGDVLYAVVGHTLGQAVYVDWDHPFVFQRHIAVLRPNPEKLSSRYLYSLPSLPAVDGSRPHKG